MLNKKSGNARGTKSVSRNRGGIKNHLGATLAVLFAALTMAILGGIVGIGTAPASAYYIKGSTQVINAELLPSIGITILDNTASSVITDLAIDILPSPTGTFGKNSAIADVFTTNRTGYTLYISSDYNNHASTATNSLINTNTSVDDTTTSSIGNIPTLSTTNVSESAFSAANSSYKNQWGYSDVWSETIGDDSYSGGSATTYNPVPVKNTQATIRDDVDRQVSSSRTTIGVGVNVDTNKASGTYRNKLVFTAVAKPTLSDFTLTFDANGGTGAPVDMTGTSSAMSRNFTVPNETPTWAGRTFLGWADSNDATEPDYRIGDTVTVYVTGAETTATKTVYAVWQANYMQDYDVRTLAVNEKITLLDKRDNTPYTVQKFNNGETWMISNLKLGYDKGYTLTDELTNIVDGNTYYIPKAGYQGSITNPATVTDTSTAANFSTTNDNLAKIQYREEGSTDNTTGNPVPEDTGYYNFYTATLGFSYYNDGKTSGSSPQDICPKGWSLPVNGGATTPRSWSALDYVFNPDDPNVGTNRTNATARDNLMTGASLGYDGYYNGTYLRDVGIFGRWWSTSVYGLNYST
ncbi:InlB B-repeat-containing protein, partial [Candidatus Saccharibacteria bacterium]|nr:InlB B-repeat-containing protein [Candidatus Saccharibacteria bacterium]